MWKINGCREVCPMSHCPTHNFWTARRGKGLTTKGTKKTRINFEFFVGEEADKPRNTRQGTERSTTEPPTDLFSKNKTKPAVYPADTYVNKDITYVVSDVNKNPFPYIEDSPSQTWPDRKH